MKLREERWNLERGGNDSFTEIGDGFSDDTNAAFIFGRKKKWTQERTVDAIAKRELDVTKPLQEFRREMWIFRQDRPQQRMPMFGRRGKGRGNLSGGAHYLFFVTEDLGTGFGPAAG